MKSRSLRSAFTLIEVLIVVVIMAVLAATIIPQFSSSTEDAEKNTLMFNLHTLRSQIELYKLHHSGAVPAITDADLPQLWKSTNLAGDTGAAGASYPLGPYVLNELPMNPVKKSRTVTASATWPPTAATADGGWLYNETTGQLAADHADYLTK
jgi:prepilin-type N-terminal cleavage/methylation domain-containing protein